MRVEVSARLVKNGHLPESFLDGSVEVTAPVTCPECRHEGRPEVLMHVIQKGDDGIHLWRCDVCEYQGHVIDLRPSPKTKATAP